MNRTVLSLGFAFLVAAQVVEAPARADAAPAVAAPPQAQAQAAPPQTAACSAPEYHQLDFWSGDWDAFESGNAAPVARVRVSSILDACVVHEDYQAANGRRGQSFSIYDASRKLWHQTWVTNHGQLLMIEGRFDSGEMVLSGADPAKGPQARVRGVWKPAEGGVREVGTTSSDGGKTWQPWFDLIFRPHTP